MLMISRIFCKTEAKFSFRRPDEPNRLNLQGEFALARRSFWPAEPFKSPARAENATDSRLDPNQAALAGMLTSWQTLLVHFD